MAAHATDWLIWVARKLASQSPGYLPRRLRYLVQKRWVDRVFPTGWMARRADLAGPDPVVGPTPQEHFRQRPCPRWHWSGETTPSIVRAVPQERRLRTVGEAEDILKRRFRFRGREVVALAPGEWAPHTVSRDWVCDLNRHHWFATLGCAYWYTGDARFLDAFVTESSDWMNRHLSRLGRLEWDTPFEVASRINAWIWAHFLFLAAPEWESGHHERLVRGMGLLAEYLSQVIEFHSPGNHILLEAKALALCGEVFPEFAGAAGWRRKGWGILGAELRKQIGSDGVHAERSTMYHSIIAGELAELWFFCRLNHLPQAIPLGEAVQKMADFQAWLDQGGGRLPLFADAHPEDSYCRFSARAAVAAAHAAGTHGLVTEPTDHSYWLLGDGGQGPAPTHPAEAVPAGHAFAEGGYFIARSARASGADVLVWNCGPVGYHLNRKHAHLDALSFTLAVAGIPLLIDPGTAEDDGRRETLRSTRAHTTVCIDGVEQGTLAARGEIWSPPHPELLLWATSDECTVMSGRHDGYRRLREPVWHVRTIIVMHGMYWLIVDTLEGSGEHRAEQRFHVAPGTEVAGSQNGGAVELTKDGVSLCLSWARGKAARPGGLESARPRLRIEPSEAELTCGRPEATWTVAAERSGPVPFELAVVASSAGHGVLASWIGGTEHTGPLTVSGPDFQHQVFLKRRATELLDVGSGWQSDARVAIVRASAEHGHRDLLLAGSSRVWAGQREYPADAGTPNNMVGLRRIALEPAGSVSP
jgi:uncharacterized heparinase superfamily protein